MLLVGCLIAWIKILTDYEIFVLPCSWYFFLLMWFRHASVWILVTMTAEKCAAIFYPIKKRIFASLKIAQKLCIGIIVFWCVWDCQRFITQKKEPGAGITWCGYDYKKISADMIKILGMCDFFGYILITSTLPIGFLT